MPAQVLPAILQFGALIAWSHLAGPKVIGSATLFIALQEFMLLTLLGFWTQYYLRFLGEEPTSSATSTAVLLGSTTLQVVLSVGLYSAFDFESLSMTLVIAMAIYVIGRSINSFQAERARSQADILLYSVEVMVGPVIGVPLSLLLLTLWHGALEAIFVSYAVAQAIGITVGVLRDRSWVRFGTPEIRLLRHAARYSLPLSVGGMFNWVTQNASRLVISYQLGIAAAGIYSLGLGLGFRAAAIAGMGVAGAAYPICVRMARAGDLDGALRQLALNAVLLLALIGATCVPLAVLGSDVLHLLIKRDLAPAIYPVLIWTLVAGALVAFRQHYLNQFFLLKANTTFIAFVCAVEAVLSVALAWAIVPAYGPTGGAIALAGTSIGSFVVMSAWAIRRGLVVLWGDLFRVAAASAICGTALSQFPPSKDFIGLVTRIAFAELLLLVSLGVFYQKLVRSSVARLKERKATRFAKAG